jgi:hypothetical protein
MRATFDYPALVRAKPRRCRAERHVLAIMRGTAEIAEVAPDQAPLACRLPGNSWATYRLLDGHFYALVDSADQLDRRLGGALTIMMADIARVAEEVRSDTLWPKLALERLRKLSNSLPTKQAADFDAYRLIHDDVFELPEYLSEPNISDIAHWEAEADDFASTVFVCDGGVWVKAPEPVIMLLSNNSVPADFSLYDKHGGSFAADIALSPNLNVYPLSDISSLDEHLAAENHGQSEHLTYGRTEVMMPEAFGDTFPMKEMERLAAAACHRFKMFYCNAGNRPLKTTPVDLSNTYFELTEALSAIETDPDSLIQSLENFADTLARHNDHPGKPANLYVAEFSIQISSNVRRVSRYWNDRLVTLPFHPAPSV